MLDYRFPTALQMVLSVAMAEQMGERSTSAILAYGLEANPSFIRKLMVPLTRDGIIVSTLGRNGSIHLGRPADKITLRDIPASADRPGTQSTRYGFADSAAPAADGSSPAPC